MGVPLAALSIQSQGPGPLDQYGKAMQIKSLAGQQQLQDIQIEQAKQDQAAYKAANTQWKPKADGTYDQNDFLDLLRKNGATPQTIMKLQTMQLDRVEKMSIAAKNNSEAATAQASLKSKNADLLAGDIDAVQAKPPEEQSAALAAALQKRVADGTLTAQDAAQYSQVQPQHLDDVKKHILGEKGFYDSVKAQADTQKAQSDAQLAQMKVKQQQGLKSGDMDSEIDQIFPPAGKTTSGPNQRFKTQANFYLQRGDLQGAQGVLSAASAEAGKTEEALNPDIQANMIARSAAQGAATAAAQTASARGSNAALASVPKELIVPATAAAEKAGNEYNDALAAARDMKTFIDDARAGNKVAYAYAPVEGVLTLNTSRGVKRVNMPEIHSYAGSGSLADKVEGWLGKNVSGASLPPDILDDMEKLHMGISSNAKKTYTGKLKNTNKTYGSAFEPVEPETDSTTSSTTPKATHRYNPQSGQIEEIKP